MTERIIDLTTNPWSTLESANLYQAAVALVVADEDHATADRDDNIAGAEIGLENALIEAGFMSIDNAIESIAIDVVGDCKRSIIVMFEYGTRATLKIEL